MDRLLIVSVGMLYVLSGAEGHPMKRDVAASKVEGAKFSSLFEKLKEFKAEDTNWSKDLLLNDAMIHMFDNSLMTDCVFEIGSENNTEMISAHSVVLAAASPVLRVALKESSNIRMKNWNPKDFKKILRYIYSGDLCFTDFEEACRMARLASNLKLRPAEVKALVYIIRSSYPNHMWQAVEFAKDFFRRGFLEEIQKILAQHGTAAMKDPKFNELTQEEVVAFLNQDDLAVNSEVEILEAMIRWGSAKVAQDNKNPTMRLIREKLGPIIKSIRFLSMTGQEFSKTHLSHGLLNELEVLAVFQFLHSQDQNSVHIPGTLSKSTQKRKSPDPALVAPVLGNPSQLQCARENKIETGFFEARNFVITDLRTLSPFRVVGLQIPKSLEGRIAPVREHFDILLLDEHDNVKEYYTYDSVPENETIRRVYSKEVDDYVEITDNLLIDVEFEMNTLVTASLILGSDGARYSKPGYKIKIVFHGNRTYPKFIGSGKKGLDYYQYQDKEYQARNYMILRDDSFVYSITSD